MVFLYACGEEVATPGATIVGPADSTFTYFDSPGFLDRTSGPLEFQVFIPGGGETEPMPGATVRYFGGSHVVSFEDRDGNTLNPDDPVFVEIQTDSRGLSPVDIYPVWFVPQCEADPDDLAADGPDVTVNGTVTATVGVASATWNIAIIVKGGRAPHLFIAG